MTRDPISISLETDFIQKIDDAKGKNEPRSHFIEDILSEFLIKKNAGNPPTDSPVKQFQSAKTGDVIQ